MNLMCTKRPNSAVWAHHLYCALTTASPNFSVPLLLVEYHEELVLYPINLFTSFMKHLFRKRLFYLRMKRVTSEYLFLRCYECASRPGPEPGRGVWGHVDFSGEMLSTGFCNEETRLFRAATVIYVQTTNHWASNIMTLCTPCTRWRWVAQFK